MSKQTIIERTDGIHEEAHDEPTRSRQIKSLAQATEERFQAEREHGAKRRAKVLQHTGRLAREVLRLQARVEELEGRKVELDTMTLIPKGQETDGIVRDD